MANLFAGTEWELPESHCDGCGELASDCNCPPRAKPFAAPETQTAQLAVEKRKRGKLMTVVRGLAASDIDLPALLTQLKTLCGAGGTVKGDQIEIQGDHMATIRRTLTQAGFRVKA